MAEQPGSGTLAGAADGAVGSGPDESPVQHAAALAHESFHGRPVSWIAVAIIIVGFVVGGAAMIPGPTTWWQFWTGVGIVVVGLAIGALSKITEDWY
jgi:hypothetical protein